MHKFSANLAKMISLFLIIFILASFAAAQDSTVEQNTDLTDKSAAATQTKGAFDRKNEFSVLGGFAPDIPRVFGGSRRSKFGFAAVRYTRHLIGSENVALKYTLDVIPLAVLNYEREPVVQTAPNTFITQRNPTTVYGVGLTPVAFQLNFRRKKKIQPFIALGAGLIHFNKSIPDDRSPVFPERRGRQFNFTPQGGGGVEFATETGKSFILGFKFHHISNASTGNINPGYDQNLFYIGYTFKKW